jgi:hypothetical protein
MNKVEILKLLRKKPIKYLIIIILLYVFFLKLVPWGLKLNMYGSDKFDSELWNKTHIGRYTGGIVHDWDEYRCSMYNDLTNNHLKKGMKLKEVTNMLGETDLRTYCTNKKVKCLKYALGSCLKGMFNKSLIVEFFGYYDRQYIYVCFDGNEEFISSGKSYGGYGNRYQHLVCEGKDNTVGCYKDECWTAPRLGGENNSEVIHGKTEFEQW